MPIFLRITPASGSPIDGGGVFPEHEKWMHLTTFKFGKAPSDTMGGKPSEQKDKKKKELQDEYFDTHVDIERMLDHTSASLMNWLKDGDPRKVEIDHCAPDGVSLFKLVLEQARLTEYSMRDQVPDGIPETLKISWEVFEIHTAEIGADGRPKP